MKKFLLLPFLAVVLLAADLTDLRFLSSLTPPAPAGPSFDKDTVSGLAHWWKADMLVTNTSLATPPSDTDNVQDVGDNADGNRTLNAFSGTYPTYHTSVKNGLPALMFNASELMETTTTGTLATTTIFMALQTPASFAAQQCAIDSTNASSRNIIWASSDPLWKHFSAGSADAGTPSVSTWYVVTARFDGANNDTFRVDGTTTSTADTGIQGMDGVTVGAFDGGAATWGNYIGEILIYNVPLSTNDMEQVEAYLAGRWID